MNKLDITKMNKDQLMVLLTGASKVATINQTYYDKYGKLINAFNIEIKDMVFSHHMRELQEKYPAIYQKIQEDDDLKSVTLTKTVTNISTWFHGWRFLVLLFVIDFILVLINMSDASAAVSIILICYIGFLIFKRYKFGSSGFRKANANAKAKRNEAAELYNQVVENAVYTALNDPIVNSNEAIKNLFKEWDDALDKVSDVDRIYFNVIPQKYQDIFIINKMISYLNDYRADTFKELANLLIQEIREEQFNNRLSKIERMGTESLSALNNINSNIQIVNNNVIANGQAINNVNNNVIANGKKIDNLAAKTDIATGVAAIAADKANAAAHEANAAAYEAHKN